MSASSDDVKNAAQSFLSGVQQDLEAYGGVDVCRVEPLRQSKDFAIAVFNAVAVVLARRYQSGALDYETADWIVNTVEGEVLDVMIRHSANQDEIDWPLKWAKVYDAFDAGEFDHFGRSKNPVQEHTDPMIKEFLEQFDSTNSL
jgi:hypothetical protein